MNGEYFVPLDHSDSVLCKVFSMEEGPAMVQLFVLESLTAVCSYGPQLDVVWTLVAQLVKIEAFDKRFKLPNNMHQMYTR